MKALSGKAVCALLERHGWRLDRINGSHHVYVKTGHAASISVPVHGNRSLKRGNAARHPETCRVERRGLVEKEGSTVRADDLLTWLRAVPFRPFRITLNSGQSYDIRHPEMIKVGCRTAHVYRYAGDPLAPFEQMEMVSLLLMERVEALAVPANTSGNGEGG